MKFRTIHSFYLKNNKHAGVKCINTSKRYMSGNKINNIPSHVDVAVIGGGSIGCNTLYHLVKLGVKDVALLEKNKLTAGTTWHSAGLVWSLLPSDVTIQLVAHTKYLMNTLEKETNLNPGWINNGGIFIASKEERLKEYKRLHSLGKAFGINSTVLSPGALKDLYPLMNVDDVFGALYSPEDGCVDPNGFCEALARGARMNGAKIFEDIHVSKIETEPDLFGGRRVTGVVTTQGLIKTNCVINCAGAWSNYIGNGLDIHVPLTVMKHAYVVTENIPGIRNMPNVRDHDASVYLRLQGDGLSVGGYEYNPIPIDELEKEFAFGLYDLDWDVFDAHIQGSVNRVPALGSTGIKSTVCGPESFTPDHKPILGEDPQVRGFYHGYGFNSAGIMLGGGCGRELAKWAINGRPDLDMFGYDIRRFCPTLVSNKKWVFEKSHESYAKNYDFVFPHDEPLAGRNMKLDPFHDILQSAGCVFQERHGWERPGWYNESPVSVEPYDYYGAYDNPRHENYHYHEIVNYDHTFEFPKHFDQIRKECLACRTNVAMFNMSYFGKFVLTGPDSQSAVDWIFTNNMQQNPGKVVYTCLLNSLGKIEGDLTVSVLDESSSFPMENIKDKGFYIAAGGGSSYQTYSHILSTLRRNKFNVRLEDFSSMFGLLSVQGRNSRSLLENLTGADLSNETFPFSTHKLAHIGGKLVRMMRVSFVGELGWELHIPAEHCVQVYEEIMKAGKKYGLINAGYRAIDSLSIEKGYRHWHADIRLDDTPQEGGLLFTCKLKSGVPFLGRDVVVRQKKEGVTKRLACFTIDESRPLFGYETIYRNNVPVGYLRRGDYGHWINKSMGYGYVTNPSGEIVNLDYLKEGEYHLESFGHIIPATYHAKSPFDPNNCLVKGEYDVNAPVETV